MKRYIILLVMLVAVLNISAQNTNQSRGTRRSTPAVKESKESTVVKKTDNSRGKSTQKDVKSTPRTKDQVTRVTKTTRTNTTKSSGDQRSVSTGKTERNRETNISRGNEVNSGNTGIRNRGSSNNTKTTTTRNTKIITTREYVPRNEKEFTAVRKNYATPDRRVNVRTVPNKKFEHRSIEYRRTYYPYRVYSRPDIFWDIHLYNRYRYLYPHYNYWYYPIGYRIQTVSAYDADRFIGEFARIYGRVFDTWYSPETDEYYLYFGEPYPYQDFTVIISGRDARRYNRHPERYFTGRHIAVTGIVSVFDGKPEMVIKSRTQIDRYF